MIGIGGAGMSALAVVAYAWGADVSGCDRAPSESALRLRRFGIDVSEGHDRAHLEPGMEVVVSSAVPRRARRAGRGAASSGCASCTAGELLAEMVAQRRSICVAGAHGKTTTDRDDRLRRRQLGLDPT